MNKKQFAKKILRCSPTLWVLTLQCKRNLGFTKAQIASQVLGTPIEVWIDKTRGLERQAAWQKFNQR